MQIFLPFSSRSRCLSTQEKNSKFQIKYFWSYEQLKLHCLEYFLFRVWLFVSQWEPTGRFSLTTIQNVCAHNSEVQHSNTSNLHRQTTTLPTYHSNVLSLKVKAKAHYSDLTKYSLYLVSEGKIAQFEVSLKWYWVWEGSRICISDVVSRASPENSALSFKDWPTSCTCSPYARHRVISWDSIIATHPWLKPLPNWADLLK